PDGDRPPLVASPTRRSSDLKDAAATPGTTRAILDTLAPNIPDEIHPRDLSEGQKLSLALSIQLAAQPPVVFFDEPTRGLDYAGRSEEHTSELQSRFDLVCRL